MVSDLFDCQFAGELTGCVRTHTVSHDEDLRGIIADRPPGIRRDDKKAILVVPAAHSGIAKRRPIRRRSLSVTLCGCQFYAKLLT
jgi:hypothetical protein